MSEKLVIYTTASCPYCLRAKDLLRRKGIHFEEICFDWDDEAQWEALRKRSGMTTVPQIFYGEKLIGGYTELAALDAKDGLVSLSSSEGQVKGK